jgi:mannitol operon repressor
VAADDLLKTHPHLKEFLPYLDLLNKESDRGKVLVSTGFLEQQLKEVLLAFMLPNDQAADLVGGHNAPLGSLWPAPIGWSGVDVRA